MSPGVGLGALLSSQGAAQGSGDSGQAGFFFFLGGGAEIMCPKIGHCLEEEGKKPMGQCFSFGELNTWGGANSREEKKRFS